MKAEGLLASCFIHKNIAGLHIGGFAAHCNFHSAIESKEPCDSELVS